MPPQAVVQQDLSRGSNLVTNPYLLGQQQGVLDVNLLLDEHGSLRTRDGTLIQTTSPDVAPSIRPIIKLFDFVRQDGTIFKLAIIQGTTGDNQLYNRGTTPWTLIGTLGTKYTLPDILAFTNLALIINGYETPRSYDGTTLTPLTATVGQTVPGGANHHALHQGFYWLWNTASASGTLDGPSSLRSSDLNNPNSWPNANQIFVDKDDGDSGQGMGQFTIAESGISPTTSQILFKTFTAYQMTGVFGSTSPVFAIQKIKSDMGCVAPRSIHFAPGFGLIRLAHRGFALFNGVDDRLISEEVRPLIFGSPNFSFGGLDWANVALSRAELIPNPPLYICACPTMGPALNRVFVYDLVRRAWTIIQFANTVASIQAIETPGSLPVILTGDFDKGSVRRIFAGDLDDDGTPVGWQAFLRPVSSPSPQQNGYYRRLVVKVINVTAGQQITALIVVGPTLAAPVSVTATGTTVVPANAVSVMVVGSFGSNYQVKVLPSWPTARGVTSKTPGAFTVTFAVPAPASGGTIDWTVTQNLAQYPRQLTKTVTLPVAIGASAASGLGYGVTAYGTSPYGGATISTPEIDLNFDIGLTGTNARGVLSGSGRVYVRGIEWHLKSKPLRRPQVYV